MNKFTQALEAAMAVITLADARQAAEPETFCKPKDLRCEMQRSPMGVDAVKPRLSWKLDDNRRGARQTAYRVLVATTSAKLAADEGDLWDSNQNAAEQSHLIQYGGKPLASGQIVHWKVKVWDKDGAESPWSGPAHWEMGLLKPEDWKGKAITATSAGAIHDPDWMNYIILPRQPEGMAEDRKTIEQNILPVNLYGKDFTLEDVPERARLYATACNNSYFALYLNGKRVGDEERTPVPTFAGPMVSYYSVYDITPLLRRGENRLRCINWSDSRWSSGRAFYMQINGVTRGVTSVLVATDATWRHHASPYVAIGKGTIFEYYDFRIPDPTLAREGVSGPDWSPVKERSEIPTLVRSIMPAERVIRRVTPVEMWSPAPGVYTFDMGEIITGSIEWKVPGDLPAGSRIVFRESCFLQRDDAPMRYDSRSGGIKGDRGGNLYYPPQIEFSDTSRRIVHYWPQNLAGMMPSVFYNENLHIKKRAAFRGGSPCHADFAQLADWFWYGLGGLRPDESHPGLKHFTLAPQIPGKMAWAKIAHESPYGKIVSSWKRDGDQIRWEVTVPPNSTATALIPATDVATIRESGKTVAQSGLTATEGPCETTRIELPPGAYVFEFRRKNQSQSENH